MSSEAVPAAHNRYRFRGGGGKLMSVSKCCFQQASLRRLLFPILLIGQRRRGQGASASCSTLLDGLGDGTRGNS